jgi:hypothetical protein
MLQQQESQKQYTGQNREYMVIRDKVTRRDHA